MDRYSLEEWMLDRQRVVERRAGEHARLHPWQRRTPVARMVAVRLRHLADRLDGRTTRGADEDERRENSAIQVLQIGAKLRAAQRAHQVDS